MFKYYHETENQKNIIFNIANLDFIDNDTFKAWFGFNKNEFQEICNFNEFSSTDIAIFLCKMRTALLNEQLSFLFDCCPQTIANRIDNARQDLLINLVPKLINCIDRSKILINNTPMAKKLFGIPDDKACCIFDATYRLTQKSKNFAGQKMLWSEQKKMPLVKPMVGCTPNGYITHVFGPYDANHNDAVILEDCFQRFKDVLITLQEGDVILVDRGFRDVITFLKEEKKFNVYCPGLGQLATIEANPSDLLLKYDG